MEEKSKPFIPYIFIGIDAIGTILLGLGIAKHFVHIDILPPAMRFENYGMAFMIIGVILMLPLVVHVITKVQSGSNRNIR